MLFYYLFIFMWHLVSRIDGQPALCCFSQPSPAFSLNAASRRGFTEPPVSRDYASAALVYRADYRRQPSYG